MKSHIQALGLGAVLIALVSLALPAGAVEKRSMAFDADAYPSPSAGPACGTVLTPEQARAYLEKLDQQGTGAAPAFPPPYYVPIAPHIVRESAGTLGLSEARYNQAVADANAHFAASGIIFYTHPNGIDYIDSDAFYYDIDTYLEIDALRLTNTVPNAINIYFTEVLDFESGALCGISAFTFSSVQAIAMRNSCTASDAGLGNHSTFSHEIGHYFDLFHTHEPAFGDERVDGSNCATAGDQLCDTPADPQLSSSTVDSGTCTYTGSATDAVGDPYAPDATQLMSYSLKHCRTNFTAEAMTKAANVLNNDRPNLISSGVVSSPLLADGPRSAVDLSVPRPNPTDGLTEMRLTLPAGAVIDVTVFDVRGAQVRTIASGPFVAGTHTVGWDGKDSAGRAAAPGIYFARVSGTDRPVAQKIQLVR